MAHPSHERDLIGFGNELRGLTPRPCTMDRDAMMFRAGQASVPRSWKWPVAALLSICIAITCMAAMIVQSAEFEPRSQPLNYYGNPSQPAAVVISDDPSIDDGNSAPGAFADPALTAQGDVWSVPDTPYFQTQNNLLRWGLDGIPSGPIYTAPPRAEKAEMLLRSF